MITMEDIARKAGVSHSTVSRALANSPLISPETRARIQELARESGYQVNQVARNLKVKSTRTIGLVVPEVSNPYYPKLIQQVADLTKAAGYNLQLHLSGADQESEAACLASLREHRADGILLVTAEKGLVALDQVSALLKSGHPIVLMGWVEGAEGIDLVTGDDAAGGYELGQHLIGLGHRHIAVVGKPPHRGQFDRLVGFHRALDEAGIHLPDEMQREAKTDGEVKDAVVSLLKLNPRPTAIFGYQDSLAALLYKHLADAGILVPSEMTVVGFDDLDLATYLTPRLTTVGTHIEPLAREFVRILLDRIAAVGSQPDGEPIVPEHVIITPKVVVRSSCAPPVFHSPPVFQLPIGTVSSKAALEEEA